MLEIVIGIVIGPAVLGWVEVDEPVEVLALVGLAFLLFLAGLEIDLAALRGALLRAASLGFAVSLGARRGRRLACWTSPGSPTSRC